MERREQHRKKNQVDLNSYSIERKKRGWESTQCIPKCNKYLWLKLILKYSFNILKWISVQYAWENR